MTTLTKTKKTIILSILALAFMFTSAISFAAYDASSESNNCGGTDCRSWHNAGITHSQYPSGTTFPTFNNYKDAKTRGTPRYYEEMQFMYISTTGASDIPWNPESTYDFSSGINHAINFTGSDTETIGFWGYMHNNGEGDLTSATANGTQIKMTGWSSSTPQTSYSPTMTLWADNTKPKTIWSNVGLNANVPFTLTPTNLYIYREDGTSPSITGPQLQSLTTTGLQIRNNADLGHGVFKSSQKHIVYIYVEFEATPSSNGVCRSLTITDPTETSITLDENGFVNENLSFTADADLDVIHGYRISSASETITFKANNASEGINIKTNDTSVKMNGGPTTSETTDTVRVWALDEREIAINGCMDSFNVNLDQEENTCETLETTPTPPGQDGPVPLNEWVTISIDKLLDTNGDLYTADNGTPAPIKYCYGNNNIIYDPQNPIYIQSDDKRCITAPYDNKIRIFATGEGMMEIKVVGSATGKCQDAFKTQGEEIEGACLDLSFNRNRHESFNLTEETQYCVTVNVEEEADAAYNDNIRWTVERDGNVEFTQETQNELCLDFEDYSSKYDYEVGDTLIAQAIVIEYEGDDCIDELTSEGECTRFDLDRDTFERGTRQEVCVDYTDWPLDENDELEYSVNNGSPETVELYEKSGEICFLLTEDMVEDADIVRVWVPGYEDACNHELTRNVEPPSFDKNAKSADALAYSSRTIANFSDDYVNYRITYTHYNDEDQDVTITDTIGTDGYIQGYIAGTQTEINSSTPKGGRIYYNEDSMRVLVDGNVIKACEDIAEEDVDTAICYNRNIGESNGVEIKNVPSRDEVLVEYSGEIDSSVNPENCSDPDNELNQTGVCGEIYPNTAEFEDETNFNGSAKAEVLIPCPFIIIRSGGDVFLENPFDYGVDTLMCSEIRNVETPVIVGIPPDDRTLNSTGTGNASVLKVFNDRLCNSAAEGSVNIKGISSLICELELTSKELTQQAIVQSLSKNVQLFARYSKNLNGTQIVNGSSALDSLNSSNNVYVKDDGMLTLGGEFADQARTIVVLNNDVYINNNLTFKDPTDLSDPRKVPSLAVIVIGGNIVIDPKVTETNAIFFVQEGSENQGGQICEAPKTGSGTPSDFCKDDTSLVDYNSESRLTHYGSIYGDIQHLLKYRVKSGDPTKEEGAILIRFDNRVYLNTPPLLNKLVDVSQKSF